MYNTFFSFLLLAFLETSVEMCVNGEAGSSRSLCLFFQWSGQGFQNEGLDHLIEMAFSSPWINCYIWTGIEDQCLRIQLHVYVGFLWKPRPCSTPYSDNQGQLEILSKGPSLIIHLKCKLPLSHQTWQYIS